VKVGDLSSPSDGGGKGVGFIYHQIFLFRKHPTSFVFDDPLFREKWAKPSPDSERKGSLPVNPSGHKPRLPQKLTGYKN